MSSEELSVLNCSDIKNDGSSSKQQLDVGDVPDRILEALHHARELQARTVDEEAKSLAQKIEQLLQPTIGVMAAAAEQLANVL